LIEVAGFLSGLTWINSPVMVRFRLFAAELLTQGPCEEVRV